jgi:hypothetical protein
MGHGPGGPDSFTRNWLFILPFCAVPASLYRTYKIGSDSPSNSYAPMNTSTASDRRSVQLDPTGETLLIQPQKEALTGRRARKTNNKE